MKKIQSTANIANLSPWENLLAANFPPKKPLHLLLPCTAYRKWPKACCTISLVRLSLLVWNLHQVGTASCNSFLVVLLFFLPNRDIKSPSLLSGMNHLLNACVLVECVFSSHLGFLFIILIQNPNLLSDQWLRLDLPLTWNNG